MIHRFLLLAYAPAAMAPSVSAAASAVVEVTLPQASAGLAAAHAELEAREAKIQSAIARNEAVLAALRKKYKNRRGRYPNPDGKHKSKADANLERGGSRRRCELGTGRSMSALKTPRNRRRAPRATSHAAHHATAPDGRRRSGGGGAAASAAPRGGQAAVDAAARGGGPDDEENDALPEGVDKRYFSASATQQAFFAEVLPEALAGRGGRHLGSGYYAYTPLGCVELGCRCCRACCRPTERGRGGCATKRSPRRVPRPTRGRTLACTDCSSNLACGGQITMTVSDDNLGCAVHE